MKTHIRKLQLMVSVDQLKKLRAQNPLVQMVSHLKKGRKVRWHSPSLQRSVFTCRVGLECFM